jgi:hypothetical protein
MCDEVLYLEIRRIAALEGLPVAEVIRQGLEWRVAQAWRAPAYLDVAPEGGASWHESLATDAPPQEEIAHYRALADLRARERRERDRR